MSCPAERKRKQVLLIFCSATRSVKIIMANIYNRSLYSESEHPYFNYHIYLEKINTGTCVALIEFKKKKLPFIPRKKHDYLGGPN